MSSLPDPAAVADVRSSQPVLNNLTGVSYYGSPRPSAPSELDVSTTPSVPEPTGRCLHCSAPSQPFLCWSCVKLLRRQLAEVPWLLRRLRESAYGEAKVARKGGPRVSTGERLPSLPLNTRAADLLRDAQRLVQWAGQVVGMTVPHTSLPDASEFAARYLAAEPGAMQRHPWAPDALRWILQWRSDSERVIDLPPDMQYAGPCQADIVEPTQAISTGVPLRPAGKCGNALYVDAEAWVVTCPRCGSIWDVSVLQQQALARVDETHPRTAADMFRLLKLIGRDVPRSTFYALMTKVEAHGYDADELPVYLYRSVIDALDERERRAAERKAATEARTAAVLAEHDAGVAPSTIARSLKIRYPAVVKILTTAGVDIPTDVVDVQTVEDVPLSAPEQVKG